MLTVKLKPGTQLDCDATRKKMNDAGFEIRFDNYPKSVRVKLTAEGDKRYKTDEQAVAALCNCFVEVKSEQNDDFSEQNDAAS